MRIKSRPNFQGGVCITPSKCHSRISAANKPDNHCYNSRCVRKDLFIAKKASLGKIAWYDVETTGLDAQANDIVQLSIVLTDMNCNILDTFDELCLPDNFDTIQQAALDCNGRTIEELKTFQPQKQTMIRLLNFLDINEITAMIPLGGFNHIWFDNKFLIAFFDKYNIDIHKYFDTQIKDYDVYKIVKNMHFNTANRKLETLCNHLNIELDAHNALSDTKATIELYKKVA